MNEPNPPLTFLRNLTWGDILLIALVLLGCYLLVLAVRRIVRAAAESAPSHHRLLILRLAPIVRLLIWIGGATICVPLVVEPTFEKVAALVATLGLTLAFALKDYMGSVIAGIVTIVENTYQPGDWIEIDGCYGEVKAIGSRAVHIVTADDTEVVIPHSRLWSSSVFNASGGKRSLLCVTKFYLRADHDGSIVQAELADVAATCAYRKAELPVKITATETPWGTLYKIKAYVIDSREQFAMITDLTIRGKERLRRIGMSFAQAPYAEYSGSKS